MINNKRQLTIAKNNLKNSYKAIDNLNSKLTGNVDEDFFIKSNISSINKRIKIIENEIAEFKKLNSNNIEFLKFDSIKELAEGLIKVRIASGLTQKEFAEKIGIKEQQIQRYEQHNYLKANFERIIQITNILEVESKFNKTFMIGKNSESVEFLLSKDIKKDYLENKINEICEEEFLFLIGN